MLIDIIQGKADILEIVVYSFIIFTLIVTIYISFYKDRKKQSVKVILKELYMKIHRHRYILENKDKNLTLFDNTNAGTYRKYTYRCIICGKHQIQYKRESDE